MIYEKLQKCRVELQNLKLKKTYDHMDNRRENLKICTQMENMQNQRTRKNSSGHKYIKWHEQSQKWEFAHKGKTLIRNNDITKVIRFRDKYFEKENAK